MNYLHVKESGYRPLLKHGTPYKDMVKTDLLLKIYQTAKVKPKPEIKPTRTYYNATTYG